VFIVQLQYALLETLIMPGKRAKILSTPDFSDMLVFAGYPGIPCATP
jgi:hypothetical protein